MELSASVRRLACGAAGLVAFVVLMVAVASPAEARKIKRVVAVGYRIVLENNGTTISEEQEFWSKQKRCLKLRAWHPPTHVRFYVSFASGEWGLYPDPTAQEQDAGGGTYLPESDSFPLRQLGPFHSRWEFPATWTFRTTNPNGTYGGTYPLSHWWFGLWHHNFANGIYSETGTSTWGKDGYKVSFRKKGNLYVFKCVGARPYGAVYDPPWPDGDRPDDEGTPVPGRIVLTAGVR